MAYIEILITFLPLILLLWLANLADKRRRHAPPGQGVALLVYASLTILWMIILAAGTFSLLMGLAYARYADIPAMTARYSARGLNPDMVVGVMQSLPRLGAGLIALALLGLTLLLPPTRRLIARILPIQADSVISAVALAYSNLILVNLWLVMGVGMEAIVGALETAPASSSLEMIAMLWMQNIMLTVMALAGVGWLSRRNWQEALQRLGFTWGGRRTVGVGVGLGLLMFLLLLPFSLLLDKAGVGVNPDIEKLTEQLLGPLMTSLPGVITLGAAAALGEELLYRGALQPRFGILLTALLFALTHNQYGVSPATLAVFLLGLILGWTRRRYNTTTSIFLHATYNIAIGLMGLLWQ